MSFEVAKSDTHYVNTYIPHLGDIVNLCTNIEIFRGIVIAVDDGDLYRNKYTVCDFGWYLNKSKETYQFNNMNAKKAVIRLCSDFNIPIDTIPELNTSITQIYIDKCIYDILSDILEKCGGGYNFDMTPNGIRIYKYGVIYAYPEFRITQNTHLIYSPTLKGIESVEDVTTDIELLLAKAEELRKLQFSYNAEMTVLENDIYINQHKLHIVEHNLIETKKDIEYAMTQEDELICPFCGTIYLNGINEQLNITSDYAHCENLIAELKSSISVATKELEELKNKYNDVSVEIQSIEQKVQNTQELLSYSSFYKSKGQFEIYESCKRQLDVLQGEINSCVSKIAITDEKINEKKSKERSKDIREDIERYCRTLADAINVPKTFIKLRDFVQVINRTGSETPRLVYMYQSALYLYNLERAYSPFNFYVVDTPNQQGQDTENLGSIFKSLELFLSDEGQVIVGTERETGMEEKASNVIKLTGKRRCLNNINYKKHIELLEKLQKTAISWVADNHNIQNEI